MPYKVAVLMGGQSFEREFSIKSGKNVCEVLASAGHDVVPLDTSADLSLALKGGKFDVAYIALHGKHGEDGTIQSLLDLLDLPYVGSTSSVCRLAWFKPILPHILSEYGGVGGGDSKGGSEALTPSSIYLSQDVFKDMGAADILKLVEKRISGGYPYAVKPARGGSAMGVHKVGKFADLSLAILDALSYDSDVLIQKWVDGVELAVSVVETRAGKPKVLPPVEIVTEKGFFDTNARLNPDGVDYYSPVRLKSLGKTETKAKEALASIESAALKCYKLLGCRDLARIDLIWDGKNVQILEIGASPGMTKFSLFPTSVEASGKNLVNILSDLLDLALKRKK
jgi:D-alanine-D-alanine ligase